MKKFFFMALLGTLFFSHSLLLANPAKLAKNWDPRLLQASDLAYQGNSAEALKLVESYVQENPLDPNGFFVQGMVLEWEGILRAQPEVIWKKQVLKIYKDASQLAFDLWHRDQENIDKLIDLGHSYLLLGRFYGELGEWLKAALTSKKAPKHLNKALEQDPKRVEGLGALGVYHYVAANTPPSLAPFKAILGIHGDKAEGLNELKRSLTGEHPYRNNSLAALYYINYEFEKNYPTALNYVSELEKKFPENPEFILIRAKVYERQDRAKGIEGNLQLVEWCQARASSCHPKYIFLGYFEAGRIAYDMGRNSQAKDLLSKAKEVDTQFSSDRTAWNLLYLGKTEQNLGNFPGALEIWRNGRSLHGLSKDVKKQLKGSIEQLCRSEKAPADC